MIFKKTSLILMVLVLLSVSVFAQDAVLSNEGIQNNDGVVADDFEVSPNKIVNTPITNQEVNPPTINKPITNQEIYSAVQFAPESQKEIISGVEYEKTLHIITTKEVTPEVQSAIYDLRVEPSKIFSPVFSSVENLVVNPTIENKKVVYNLVVEDQNKPIFREKEVIQPIFDLRVDEPVEFKLVDNRIIINDEQIIDYKEIVQENEVMPPIELEINSAITNGKIYDLKVIPSPESAEFKFIYREKEVMMPVHSDFKVEDKKLNLIHNGKPYDLRINPAEIYSAVYDLRVKEPKVVIKKLSLGIENEKAAYDLRVEEPAKILWIFPTTVESKYLIDPADGSAELVNNPWYITSRTIGADEDDIVSLYPEYNPLE